MRGGVGDWAETMDGKGDFGAVWRAGFFEFAALRSGWQVGWAGRIYLVENLANHLKGTESR